VQSEVSIKAAKTRLKNIHYPMATPAYQRKLTLSGHRDAIFSMAISTDGRTLASGGEFTQLSLGVFAKSL
jgi:hypothetical protein